MAANQLIRDETARLKKIDDERLVETLAKQEAQNAAELERTRPAREAAAAAKATAKAEQFDAEERKKAAKQMRDGKMETLQMWVCLPLFVVGLVVGWNWGSSIFVILTVPIAWLGFLLVGLFISAILGGIFIKE